MSSTRYSIPSWQKWEGKKNEEPKVPLKISENMMISGAALREERNSI